MTKPQEKQQQPADKAAAKADAPPKDDAAAALALEDDDLFEDFASHVVKDAAHAAEEENQDLWVADWDDEATGEDFQQKLKRELGDKMAE